MNRRLQAVAAVSLGFVALAGASRTDAQKRPKMNTVTITAHDFKFTAPGRVPAGLTRFRFINEGTTLHHAQLVKFSGSHTVKEFIAALTPNSPPPTWATEVGGPNAVGPKSETAVIQSLEPGNYAILCFVDTPDHVPHIMKGMYQDLTVTRSGANSSALPEGDISVSLVDYNFKWSEPLTAGPHRVTITTDADQPHELTVLRVNPGRNANDVMGWLEKMDGPPPAKAIGGVAGLVKGRPVSVGLVFTPADYIFICFVPDAKDGKPHFMHGMVQTVTVK
ncbi:MAG: hypothetical protein H0W69_05610 [Gemmatimonadaceae bacterium]|nr:hypothetical protein [Gemmatimonadaceae bacterium]